MNDIKEFKVPITDHWKVNKVFLQSCLKDMKLPKHFKPILQLHRIEEVLSKLNGRRPPQNFLVVVPEWTCCLWYKQLLETECKAEWIKFPGEADDFVDDKHRALGEIAWDNWLVVFNAKLEFVQ